MYGRPSYLLTSYLRIISYLDDYKTIQFSDLNDRWFIEQYNYYTSELSELKLNQYPAKTLRILLEDRIFFGLKNWAMKFNCLI